MNLAGVLTPLPVLIPTLGAAATLLAGRRVRLQRVITTIALSAVVVVCSVLLGLSDGGGTMALHVGGWGPTVAGIGPLGITLVVDRLSALMLVVSSIVLLAVMLGGSLVLTYAALADSARDTAPRNAGGNHCRQSSTARIASRISSRPALLGM